MIWCVEGHQTAERRSLAYHRAIAERIVRDPSLVAAARARVDAWRDVHARYALAWREKFVMRHYGSARRGRSTNGGALPGYARPFVNCFAISPGSCIIRVPRQMTSDWLA